MPLTSVAFVFADCHFASVKLGGLKLSSPLPSSRWHFTQYFLYSSAAPPPALLPFVVCAADSSHANEAKTATDERTKMSDSGFLMDVFILLRMWGRRWPTKGYVAPRRPPRSIL